MLTLDQIKNISFKKASIGGYRCEEVDAFIDSVAETVEELKKKNAETVSKLETLAKGYEELRSNQDSVSQVLLKAQREADKTEKDAKKAAAATLKDAHAEAERIVAEAENRIIKEKQMLVQLEEEAAEIRKKLIESFERQIESLRVLPEEGDPQKLKKSLDERYPVESLTDEKFDIDDDDDDDDDIDSFTSIEEAAKDAKSATEDSANAEAKAQPVDIKSDSDKESDEEEADPMDEKIQIDKSKFEARFGKLKFGEDYDVKKAD